MSDQHACCIPDAYCNEAEQMTVIEKLEAQVASLTADNARLTAERDALAWNYRNASSFLDKLNAELCRAGFDDPCQLPLVGVRALVQERDAAIAGAAQLRAALEYCQTCFRDNTLPGTLGQTAITEALTATDAGRVGLAALRVAEAQDGLAEIERALDPDDDGHCIIDCRDLLIRQAAAYRKRADALEEFRAAKGATGG